MTEEYIHSGLAQPVLVPASPTAVQQLGMVLPPATDLSVPRIAEALGYDREVRARACHFTPHMRMGMRSTGSPTLTLAVGCSAAQSGISCWLHMPPHLGLLQLCAARRHMLTPAWRPDSTCHAMRVQVATLGVATQAEGPRWNLVQWLQYWCTRQAEGHRPPRQAPPAGGPQPPDPSRSASSLDDEADSRRDVKHR